MEAQVKVDGPVAMTSTSNKAPEVEGIAPAMTTGSKVAPASGRTDSLFGWLSDSADIILLGVVLLAAYWPILEGMYQSWFIEAAYMEHGILVIPAAAYMAWTKKDRLKAIPRQGSPWGVLLLLCGALQALFGLVAQWIWVTRMSFLVALVGYLAVVFGWRVIRELTYPLCTLILMIAPPTFIFERLTLSLQLLASRLGEIFLEALGYSVLRQGNILEMVGLKLSVEEACSGIRSLLAIFFMCVLYNYFFVQGRAMKALLLVLVVPIAILGNTLRIVASGVAGQYNPALVHGASHEAFGYVSVIAAALGVVGLHLALEFFSKVWRAHHA